MATFKIQLSLLMLLLLPIATQAEEPSKARVRDSSEAADRSHGRVAWKLHKHQLAWINVGIVDGVDVGSRFTVYAADEPRTNESAKGELVVVRVIEKHLAEVRITNETPGRPILPGDLIVSLQSLVPRKFIPPCFHHRSLIASDHVQDTKSNTARP